MTTAVVSFKDANGTLASCQTSGDSLYDLCSTAMKVFTADACQGIQPTTDTILEVAPLNETVRYKVK